MHQDIVPLCAADIQEQLKKRFAYLSGEFRKPGPAQGWKRGSLQGYCPPYIRRCFVAVCEVSGGGEEVAGPFVFCSPQCPRLGESSRKEVYLAHRFEGPGLRDAAGVILLAESRGECKLSHGERWGT